MTKLPRILSILALLGLAFGGPAFAQLMPQASQDNPEQLIQSYRQKNRELQGIQQKALQENPKLAAEMKHFEAEMTAGMRSHGYDAAKRRKSVQAMIARIKTGKDASGKEMNQAERMSTMKSYQAEVQMMMKARAQTLKDPKVQKDRKALADHLIAAMKKQDSRTTQLLADVKALRAKITASMAGPGAGPGKGR